MALGSEMLECRSLTNAEVDMSDLKSELLAKHCEACRPGTPALSDSEVMERQKAVTGWEYRNKELVRVFKFKNYYETMAFVNAIAYVAHREDHHPDMEVGYNTCKVRFSTHSVGGLSENDFIMAAKVDGLQRS